MESRTQAWQAHTSPRNIPPARNSLRVVFLPQFGSLVFFQVLFCSLTFCVLWSHCVFGLCCLGVAAAVCFFAPVPSLEFCTPLHELKWSSGFPCKPHNKPRGLQKSVVIGDPPCLECSHSGWYVPVAATITGLSQQDLALPQLLCGLLTSIPPPVPGLTVLGQKEKGEKKKRNHGI